MFGSLTKNLTSIFDKLRGRGLINEEIITEVAREIRIALLEADVALPVVKEFINDVKSKALGQEVIKSITPGQMVVKIISDQLEQVLQSDDAELSLQCQPPAVIMMLGLQGSGKTTSTAKLALRLHSKRKKKVLMASLDVYRPAAQQQLATLGKQISIDTLPIVDSEKPLEITTRALNAAKIGGYDVLILDTAGRLHTDNEMMDELSQIVKLATPIEKLLVADSLTGQDAVNIASEFNNALDITGIILSRVDGDAKGGAALSMRYITKKPIKFMGVGEKPSEFEEFDAKRIASRILDMGDVVGLVEKAQELMDEKTSKDLALKLQQGKFDMDDLLQQLKSVKKIGGASKLISMIPGFEKIKSQMSGGMMDEKILHKTEAIISSMTKKERKYPDIINASRRKRIAFGSGTKVEDVNRLLKQHLTMSKMMKKVSRMDPKQMSKLENMFHG